MIFNFQVLIWTVLCNITGISLIISYRPNKNGKISLFRIVNIKVPRSFTNLYGDKSYFGLPQKVQVERFDDSSVASELLSEEDLELFADNITPGTRNGKTNPEQLDPILQAKERMRLQLSVALDNLYPHEIDAVVDCLWSNNEQDLLVVRLKMMELTAAAEQIQDAFTSSKSNRPFAEEYLSDEMRVVRSRMRTYCSDSAIRKRLTLKSTSLGENKGQGLWGMIQQIFQVIKRFFSNFNMFKKK